MNRDSDHGVAPPVEPGPESARNKKWVLALAIGGLLLVGACAVTLLLVLTGIIAEPVTVIEQILTALYALFGGGG